MLYNTSVNKSTKWKKRFMNLSNKLQRTNHHHWNASNSATAMAAATEKFIRNTPSEIMVHSEDLTASQFANLTGIKTRTYYNNNNPGDIYFDDEESDDEEEEDTRDFYTSSLSSHKQQQSQSGMKIWDSHFWRDDKCITSSSSMKELSTKLTSQPLSRHTSEPGGQRVPSMVQKGRFKIVWGGDDNEPITPPVPQCIEWKRKRACSASTVI